MCCLRCIKFNKASKNHSIDINLGTSQFISYKKTLGPSQCILMAIMVAMCLENVSLDASKMSLCKLVRSLLEVRLYFGLNLCNNLNGQLFSKNCSLHCFSLTF